MNKKIFLTITLLLVFFSIFANASYILQLKYENGVITQEAVYSSEAIATPNYEGALDLTLGNYSTTVGVPILEAVDGPSGKVGIREKSSAEIFVVVDEVPASTILTIKDITGATLLSEPLKPVLTEEEMQTSSTQSDDGAGLVLGGLVLIIFIVIGLAIILVVGGAGAYFLLKNKKIKKK